MIVILATLVLGASRAHKPVMTFDDEFNGKAMTAPSTAKWGRDLGGNGFGNNELESYTDGNQNAFLDGKGHLIIEARKEKTTGKDGRARDYSSARLKTEGRFSQTYGHFEARIQIPRGKGIWPAFWMLGANIGKAGWPGCGEIDILESIGEKAETLYGTLHGPGYSGGQGKQGRFHSPETLANAFHVYAVDWSPGLIRWSIDGHEYHKVTPNDLGGKAWVFDGPQFIIMDLAVGGGWPGNPDDSTQFPQRMVVDYVRVYEASK